jgi:GT2 family glycosyltransferase/glycosyltransferase involved in cell wall biosynthesis
MRVLLVVHGFPPAASGGTELYVRHLAIALARSGRDDVCVLTRDRDPHRPELSVRRTIDTGVHVVAINNTFQSCETFEESYTHPGLRRIAAGVIDELRPDVAHVHHLTCLSTGLLDDLAARAIPVLMTLNDYWLICHRGQLLDLDAQRCDGPFEGGCGRCLPAGALAGPSAVRTGRLLRSMPVPGAAAAVHVVAQAIDRLIPAVRTSDAMQDRLAHMQAACRHVARFLAPSATIAAKFREFGIERGRLVRCNQGIDLAPFAGTERVASEVLRVGFAGSLIPSKAPHILLEAASRLPEGLVTVDLLGGTGTYHGDDDYSNVLEPLLKVPFLRRLGPVPHERMARALLDLDVVVVPSVWIENAPFIIRESFAAGAPVIACDMGGMAEMVRHDVDGLLVPPGDPEALAAALRRLACDRSQLDRLRGGIRRPMSIEEDAEDTRRHYVDLAGSRADPEVVATTVARAPRSAASVAAVVLNYRTPDQACLAVRSTLAASTRPGQILVIDNGSDDGSMEQLRASLHGVDVIDTGSNLGFAGGCNVGIRAALDRGAQYVLLVNSDAILEPSALDRLLTAVESDPTLGIVGPVLLSLEEPDRIASAGITFSTRTGRMRHRAAGLPVSRLPPGALCEVDAVSGCVMLISRQVIERAGLFDEDYFFSFEDIDLCVRARQAGFTVGCAQEAFVLHEGGRTIGRRSPRRVYFATRNHLRLASLAGAGRGRRLRGGLVVGLNAAYVLVAPEAPLVSGLAAVARGTWHHVIGRYGPD